MMIQRILFISTVFVFSGFADNSNVTKCVDNVKCSCLFSRGMITADCSNRNLTNFPQFAENIEIILLNNNKLTQFQSDALRNLTHLKVLDLSTNKLALMSRLELPFKSLVKLKVLRLHNNQMNYSMFGKDLFSSLEKLEELDLSKNMNIWPHSYPEAITKCRTLRLLKLDGIKGASFNANYKELTSLEQLSLSGFGSNCNLDNIESSYFKNIPVVHHLDLSFCHVNYVELGTFQHLEYLTSLNLSYNHGLTFRNVRNITTDLGYTNITTLDLSAIHCTYGVGTYLYVDDVIGLQNTPLQELYLDSNRITMVEEGGLSILPQNISLLSVLDNKFTMGMYVMEIGKLRNLKTLNADYQFHSHNPNGETNRFIDCKDWRGPNHNQMNPLLYGYNFEQSELEQTFLCNTTDIPKVIFTVPKKLERISFAMSWLQYTIPCLQFSENRVKYIDIRNNVFSRWDGPIYGVTHVEYLDLSSNYCSFVSKMFLSQFISLKFLNVSNNMLGFVLGQDEDGETFSSQSTLQHLDLSNNRIGILQKKTFKNLSSLEILDLSNNKLYDWTFNIIQMTKIKLINMTNNEISSLSSSIRSQIDALKMITNISIDLNRNNLQCTCDTLEFMEWMVEYRHFFRYYENYNCYLGNHSTVSFSLLDRYIPEFKRNCNSYIGLIFGVIAALITCIIVVLGGLVYRYRWRLRYIYFLAKNRYRGYSNIDLKTDGIEYRYDAFVSYSDKDCNFVIKDVQQRIEKNKGFRLCFHQRDFIAGEDIAANITNAIQHSRKTIAILSRNYLNSYWCMFEFNMARMESIYSRDGKNVLFFVLYEDIPPRDLPLKMMDIIESQSYIEYPRDQLGNEVFWDKIANAIET